MSAPWLSFPPFTDDQTMTIKCPQQYSVWENDKGGKLFVEHVYDEATDPEVELEEDDEPQFFVTVVPYADRDDMDAIAEELDAEQWAELIETDGMRQTGIEPPEGN
ncbi:hypothetical protein [Burkholderia sp. Se-20378]|uniref:hypothetical protein n=1 Tax=Burkholderia sp. Se-20378 TaxID=2703899 RepID=UPI00197FDAEF|nr:hypothetical protein [Burkholderia sp. Se-20378]MBN3770719.1 hypothetical protein [Burkholderia sp. Se-20378]